jgi:hypothetical protein
MLGEHGSGYGFESRHPRHPSSMVYKLALSESGAFQESSSATFLLPIREGLRHTTAIGSSGLGYTTL